MPLLAAGAAFGLARSGQLFLRAVAGMGLGFAYFVVDNFALAMGNLGAYQPMLAAWAPFGLFLLIGETVLIRTAERRISPGGTWREARGWPALPTPVTSRSRRPDRITSCLPAPPKQ